MNAGYLRIPQRVSYGGWRRTAVASCALAICTALVSEARAQEGAQLFRNACGPCHSTNTVHRIGPSLVGIVGRVSGTAADFEYSPAMQKAAVTWDAATLDRFLAAPNSVIKGTKMSYPGLKDEPKRKAIVEFVTGLR
jgi:cytochrome c2